MKNEELIDVVNELQDRVGALEHRPAQKGPPGDITAALQNCERAVPGFVSDALSQQLAERVREILPEILTELIKRLEITTMRGSEGPQGQAGPRGPAPTKEAVQIAVAEAITASQLFDESGGLPGPLLKFVIQQELNK